MYHLEFTSSAARQLRKLPREVQRRLAVAVNGLEQEPRPQGVTKLSAEAGIYRIGVGDYRVLFQANDKILLVLVVSLGDRKDIYR
ncbi:MAG TPA: type II toxin-antitoxin system RelE/ParE family toxin [Gemmatimonadales bacterium]|jgi:mRNA interferase RelE/StbE|nr:type II toxin-antitoxin system RelE/ParE family toxin [Gemmatimonadales bacterium]